MTSTNIAHIGTVNAMLASMAAGISSVINNTQGGPETKLAVAERLAGDLVIAEQAIAAHIGAAKDIVSQHIAGIRADLNKSATERVIDLLKSGAISLEQLAAQIGVSAPVVAIAPAPAAVAAAPVASPAPCASTEERAKLPQAIRTNLALQAGYMHAVKYRDPATGAGWSGRGPTPKWLKDLCVDGRTKDDFLVAAASAEAAAPAAGTQVQAPAAAPAVDKQEVETVEAQAPAAPDAVAMDIGSEVKAVTFDASDINADLNAPIGARTEGDDDIGEFVLGIAAGQLTEIPGSTLPSNVLAFKAAA